MQIDIILQFKDTLYGTHNFVYLILESASPSFERANGRTNENGKKLNI